MFSANNRIGGLTAAARNVISGNQGTGISLQNPTATGNLVQGNYIGVNAAGTGAAAETAAPGGIPMIAGATGNTIGGAVAGAGNVVSGTRHHHRHRRHHGDNSFRATSSAPIRPA